MREMNKSLDVSQLTQSETDILKYIGRAKLLVQSAGHKVPMTVLKLGLHLFLNDFKTKILNHEYLITFDEYKYLECLVRGEYSLDSPEEVIRKIEDLAQCKLSELTPSKSRAIMSLIINHN